MKKRILIAITTALIALFSTFALAQNDNDSFTPGQTKAIEKIVHDYLVKNPNVLIEASQSLQKQEAEKQQKEATTAISANKQALFDNPTTPFTGNPNGNVIVVEFFDYQCGHCKAMNEVIQALIKKNKNLKVVFKELPIFGDNSRFAAKMALASAKEGKYYEFHDALLAAKNPLTPARIKDVAKKLGLNVSKLEKLASTKEISQQLRDNFELAQNLKLVGTPAFVVSNKEMTKFKFIPGAVSEPVLQKQINTVE